MAKADYVFLVHPRSFDDIYRKYPDFRTLPERFLEKLMFDWPCVTLAEMNGVKSKEGKPLNGLLMSVSFTPSMMRKKPKLFKEKIAEAVREASLTGAKIIGLGGLIPSFTKYGTTLKKFANGSGLTTGHSYAAYTITNYVEQVLNFENSRRPVVAILGAAGSTGSLTVERIIERNIRAKLLLLDVPKKAKRLDASTERYREKCRSPIDISVDLSSLKLADVIVVVTNAEEAIIRPEHVTHGAVIIDDTQPRNTSEGLLKEATVIDVLSHVPGLKHNFDLGLIKEQPDITFTCLAETIILAAHSWQGDFSIGIPGISKVKEIASMAENYGAAPAVNVYFSRLNTNSTEMVAEDKLPDKSFVGVRESEN